MANDQIAALDSSAEFRDRVYALWPNLQEMAKALGVGKWAPYGWKDRGKIPPARHDLKIIARAKAESADGVTLEAMARWRAEFDTDSRMT